MSPVQPSLGECRIDAVTVQRACLQSLSNKNLRTHKQMNDGSFIFKLFTRLVGAGGLMGGEEQMQIGSLQIRGL